MFLSEELAKDHDESIHWSVLTPNPAPPKHRAVDIHAFIISSSPVTFMVICDGQRCAVAQTSQSMLPPINDPNLVRFATISYTGIVEVSQTAPSAVKAFVKAVNGTSAVLQVTNVTFNGRGPVLTKVDVPRFDMRAYSEPPNTLEDEYGYNSVPAEFTAERPRKFQPVDDDCSIM